MATARAAKDAAIARPAGISTPWSFRWPDGPSAARSAELRPWFDAGRLVPARHSSTLLAVTSPPLDLPAAMAVALEEASTAGAAGEVPVGAVVLVDGQIVARAGNERERRGDPTAHAEVLALRAAAEALGRWRLDDATLVVTLEPCPMCAGALLAGRVTRVVFGAANTDNGACGTLYNLCVDPRLNHEVEVVHGVDAAAATALLDAFFASRRR
jgi:tRNA(adenine34) deaminase